MDEGLEHVYTGNVHDAAGGTTFCASCAEPLIVRDWHRIEDYRLTADGKCPKCATEIPGRFEAFDKARQFGRKRIPVRIEGRGATPA